jgi:putative transposase
MVWSVLYLVLRRLIDRSGCGSSSVTSQDVEIAVVRHQLNILRRQMRRPHLHPTNRAFLAAASWLLPRDRWASFMVTPQTLLRWHRELAWRKWTYRRSREFGRPPIRLTAPAIVPSQSSQYMAR